MSGLCLYVSIYDALSIFILFLLNVSLIYLTILSVLFYLIRCLHPSLSLHLTPLTPGLSPCPFSSPSSLLPPSSSLSLPPSPFHSLSLPLPNSPSSFPISPLSLSPFLPLFPSFHSHPFFSPLSLSFFPIILSPIHLSPIPLYPFLPSLPLSLPPPSACYKSSITRLTFNHQQLFNAVPDPASPAVTNLPWWALSLAGNDRTLP